MLKEIVGRRYREREGRADLIVVDEKGTGARVTDTLTMLGLRVPLRGPAQSAKSSLRAGRSAPVEVPQIALNVLMRVRDEAH